MSISEVMIGQAWFTRGDALNILVAFFSVVRWIK